MTDGKFTMCQYLFSVLSNYYTSCRYQGVVISCDYLPRQSELAEAVREYYPAFDYWHQADAADAPPWGCYVTEFCQNVFRKTRQGLIILDPEQWLSQWSGANQATFWSQLSGHYAAAPIIAIAKDVPATTQHLENHFKPQRLTDARTRFWVSKYHNN